MRALPEQGQIASVRQRRYVVSDVRTSALPSNPLYGFEGEPQHLVTLASIEDDALGETLQVIWETATEHHRRHAGAAAQHRSRAGRAGDHPTGVVLDDRARPVQP